MTPSETIRLQALKLKQLTSRGGDFSEDILEDLLVHPGIATDEESNKLRNICALISAPLFAEVEGLANMLELSKRRIVEMALIEFLAKAGDIVNEVNPLGEVA